MPGLDSTGFTTKTLQQIIDDLKNRSIAAFGDDTNVDDDGVLGQIIGIVALSIVEVWELAQAQYDAFHPDNAQGIQLDNVSGLVGVIRNEATEASGTVTVTGTPGTVLLQGRIVSRSTDNAQFLTQATVTIPVGGSIDVEVEAEEAGFLPVAASEIDTIVTPVSGWDSVTNAAKLLPGQDQESDADLRLRRQQGLSIISAATDASIQAAVAEIDDVEFAIVISNRTSVTSPDGIPPKAFETIVWPDTGIDELVVLEAIFEKMPAGIEPHGVDVVGTVNDSQGIAQTVKFSYATEIPMGIEVDLTTGVGFPGDGITQVEDAIKAVFTGDADEGSVLASIVGNGLSPGEDVLVLDLLCAARTVAGVRGAVIRLDKKSVSFPPVGTVDVAIALREIATLADADLTVVVV